MIYILVWMMGGMVVVVVMTLFDDDNDGDGLVCLEVRKETS